MTSNFTAHKFFRFLWVGVVCSLPVVVTAVRAEETTPQYRFVIINSTDSPITELYVVVDTDQTQWGPSLLIGEPPIPPNGSAEFAWEDEDWEEGDPCLYDVFTRSADRTEGFAAAIDFCDYEGDILEIEVSPK